MSSSPEAVPTPSTVPPSPFRGGGFTFAFKPTSPATESDNVPKAVAAAVSDQPKLTLRALMKKPCAEGAPLPAQVANSAAEVPAAPASRFTIEDANSTQHSFVFGASRLHASDLEPVVLQPRPSCDRVAWKRWLERPIPKRPGAFDTMMNAAMARGVVTFFATLTEREPTVVPRPLAAMALQLVMFCVDGKTDDNEFSASGQVILAIASPMDCLLLQSPNWWRNVGLRGNVSLAKFRPRLRSLHIDVPYSSDGGTTSHLTELVTTSRTLQRLRVSSNIPPSDFAVLPQFKNLRAIQFHAAVSNEHLSVLSMLPSLAKLMIDSCDGVTDARPLAGCRALTALRLEKLPLISEALEGLETLPALRTLFVSVKVGTLRVARGCGFLGLAPALTDLTLASMILKKDELNGLVRCQTLKQLKFTEVNLSDISCLSELRVLETLHIVDIPMLTADALRSAFSISSLNELVVHTQVRAVNDAGGSDSATLAPATQLERLCIGMPGSSNGRGFDDTLKLFPVQPTVKTLKLEMRALFGMSFMGSNPRAEELHGLEAFPNVTNITLSSQRFIDESFAPLHKLPSITTAFISNAQMKNASLLCQVNTITKLSLAFCHSLLDEAVHNVAQMVALTDLTLSHVSLVTDVRPVLTAPSKLRRLSLINLHITDTAFGVPSPSITDLTVANCSSLSHFVCLHLVAAASTLRTLSLSGNGAILQHVDRLRTSMPHTKVA